MKLPQGFLLSGIHCGIKRKKLDLGLIYLKSFGKTVAFFTTNVNPSYSVVLSKINVKNLTKAIITNSGNANCYSHNRGLEDTKDIIDKLASALGVKPENALIASTGIIGKKLPKDKIIKNIPELIKNLNNNPENFAKSILTTDNFSKTAAATVLTAKGKAVIAGFAKGAGMIYPNMATMLSFIITDVDLPQGIFRKIAKEAVNVSFNSISVDGCMSTNDTVFFTSSRKITLKSKKEINDFALALKTVCLSLAKKIIQDAEGATKFIEIHIKGAKNSQQAKRAGLCLANSTLFKCALYGENSNWGRIISALGQEGIKVKKNIKVITTPLAKKNITITIDLKSGRADWVVYTSDLTPEYVRINAEYS
ncbi:MAG: bifunctional ornithine acetyltransferase/N-acetylglutamate synthase [Candidatus Omnitrophica bacterium]|jgi:glutamate N-acetyltransferase/amino-acid N-acetyltransferase|nr:bifunctional ornithine acetyltransferase/N-acetylglutamate synthase [Candidatus Omnitrophota bacterium]